MYIRTCKLPKHTILLTPFYSIQLYLHSLLAGEQYPPLPCAGFWIRYFRSGVIHFCSCISKPVCCVMLVIGGRQSCRNLVGPYSIVTRSLAEPTDCILLSFCWLQPWVLFVLQDTGMVVEMEHGMDGWMLCIIAREFTTVSADSSKYMYMYTLHTRHRRTGILSRCHDMLLPRTDLDPGQR